MQISPKHLRQLLLAFVAGVVIAAATPMAIGDDDKMKVVYHVADVDKVSFAINNIRNHIKGVGGPENVDLVLVTHGPALKAFHDIEATDKLRKMLSELQTQGVEFDACGNTMNAQGVEVTDLLPGMVPVDQGGVVRIAELQQQGYVYIRP